ncbi:gelsolin, cytoplasmic-like isoform X1 [Cydia fagiglandana]|uniref:gelsolin, cytoplasmic-like isoform X1 n=2 Tax=Cydia fagiglandana TaxID=1458189 RepID=UPI002FEE3B36
MTQLRTLAALLLLAGCAYARTATRTPAVTGITSLTDKDARHKAMVHPAFANAGRQAGVEVWRIEDFNPVPVPQKDVGKFYKGDSYIVLKTSADKRNNLSWDIHYWIGSESTQDESGAAAILTVGLDDKFGGAAIQHRETLGHESAQFLQYFQPAIRYLDGGHASGFNHVTTNAGAAKRLFQIKGKRNVRVRQVDPLISSMNKGDCFILDVDQNIYVYVGDKAKNVEKLKAISVANQIRDQDHNGRGRVEILDQYSTETDIQKFFTALGSGSKDSVPEESAGGDDQAFERSEEQTITLSEISDSTGSLKITPLSKPFRQEQLKPAECYILDTVSGSIYVWVGKQSTDKEKSEAMNKAQQYLSAKNYPKWVQVTRIPQGTEPAAFKQYFATWRDVGMAHNRLVRSLSDEEYFNGDEATSAKRARVVGKTGSARGFMPDQGDGEYVVYRIEGLELAKAYDSASPGTEPGKRFGELYQGDSYVIQYEYQGETGRGHIVYFWLGKDSTLDEKTAAAIQSVGLDNALSGKATLVRVPQGEEPQHFLKIFKGRLVTLLGGKASGFRNSNQKDNYDTDGVRLFRIHGTKAAEDMRAEQVPEVTASLQPEDVFLLETPNKIYVWHGQTSSDVEQQEAAQFVERILGADKEFEVITQGNEPDDFWSYLTGDASQVSSTEAWRERVTKRLGAEPRLFDADLSGNSAVSFEEIFNIEQKALHQDDVYVLDSGDELYVWIGKETSDAMKKAGNHIAEAYLRKVRHAGTSVAVVIKQDHEPELFKAAFGEWDPQMWLKNKSSEEEINNDIDVE